MGLRSVPDPSETGEAAGMGDRGDGDYYPQPMAGAGVSQFHELLMQSWSSVLDEANTV